jgi:hypothetical protein
MVLMEVMQDLLDKQEQEVTVELWPEVRVAQVLPEVPEEMEDLYMPEVLWVTV